VDTRQSLLVLLAICSALIMLMLLRRSIADRNRLRALATMTRKMLGASQGDYPSPAGRIEEAGEALKLFSTRLRTLEADLRGEREKSTAMMSTISAGIVVLDRERHVASLNEAAEKLLKVRGEEALGNPFIALTRDHEMDGMAQRCLETGQRQARVVQFRGGKQYLEVTATTLKNGALGVCLSNGSPKADGA
jgi:PAS domain-containing protein